jgi:hypothetical protein
MRTSSSQPVEIRCFDLLRTVAAQIIGSKGVYGNEKEAGLVFFWKGLARRAKRETIDESCTGDRPMQQIDAALHTVNLLRKSRSICH